MAAHPLTPMAPKRPMQERMARLSLLIISLIGIAAFVAPFFASTLSQDAARAQDSLLITLVLTVACLAVLFANLGPSLSSKSVALLGVLVSINAILRMLDLSFLPPGEFSPMFLLIILVGYIFGAQMGFLMGALSLLASAFITAGFGPWLPFQMFAAGWVGLTAAWLRPKSGTEINIRRAVIKLAMFGFVWGFLYGAILNLYFWPYQAWTPGLSLGEAFTRYAAFYIVQSLPFDFARTLGNVALILVLGEPLLRAFGRFRAKFEYAVVTPT